MTQKAIYPGTFDPITNGHLDIVERAARLFGTVVIAVAHSQRKHPFLPLEKRLSIINVATKHLSNVQIEVLEGLLVTFAQQKGARFILRGLRAVSDFDYEFQLAGMNRQMAPDIETIFLPATEGKAYISGTMVREIAELGGDISPFVPPAVLEAMK
ncbi:MAG TPA: pantetheine-phosphate adenylyltransferase [Coxiellaceae bacterium]|nr:pantetheine-phosphate adenylyltransferase [Coxiellaceae bacterium]